MAGNLVRCKDCGRRYTPDDQVDDLASYMSDPFAREVIQDLAKEFNEPRVWEAICIESFRKKLERARDEVAGQTIDVAQDIQSF